MAIGDRPDTDGLFGIRAGYSFGLVLSGVTARSEIPADPAPDVVADDLKQLVEQHFGLNVGRGPSGP